MPGRTSATRNVFEMDDRKKNCFACDKPGHYAKDCPEALNRFERILLRNRTESAV